MLNKSLTIGIIVFWVAMMAQLAHREVLPTLRAVRATAKATGYSELERLAAKPRVDQMGVYLGKDRIGYSLSRLQMSSSGELRMENRTNFRLSLSNSQAASALGAAGLDLSTHFVAHVRDGELLDFRVTVASPPGGDIIAAVEGVPLGKTLQLKFRQGGNTRIETIPFDSRRLISSGFAQATMPQELKVGMQWPISAVNPLTGNLQISQAEVVGMQDILYDGNNVSAYLIEVTQGTGTMKIWVDDEGTVLRQQLFNLTFIREPAPADALERDSL